MTIEVTGTTVEILGKSYQFRCPENEVQALKKAANALQEKMHELRQVNNVLSLDRLAILAALIMTHQFLLVEEKDEQTQKIQLRLKKLKSRLDDALSPDAQLELTPAE